MRHRRHGNTSRSDDVVRLVLDAAIAELAGSGYAAFRMDEVATRAGVNRTTVYRRWPSREALVAAVVERLRTPLRQNPLPDTGTLEQLQVKQRARTHPNGEAFLDFIDASAFGTFLRPVPDELRADLIAAFDAQRGPTAWWFVVGGCCWWRRGPDPSLGFRRELVMP